MNTVNEGLICTNDKCVGCNKCIGVCSCLGATIATESVDGNNVIKVDGSKCIACGACFDACEHHAREYVDDTASFFEALQNGEDISVMVAPAFVANYPHEYQIILGKLKALGVNRILSVAFGANITTWAYLNYISKYNFKGGISQPCPATVEYIERYIPELIPKLMPVQSPMMCMAIYAKKHLHITGKLAFIGPCIAKKSEIMSKRGKDMIAYNVTFDHMMKKLRTMDVEPLEFVDETEFGLGSVYAMTGGLKENIHWFLGSDAYVRQIDGEKNLYKFLQENKERILSDDPVYTLYDALNCSEGCLCGTGVEMDQIDKEETLLEMIRISKRNKSEKKGMAWSLELTPKQRLDAFNKEFEALSLEDYLCEYEDHSKACTYHKVTEEELDITFVNMNKITKEERNINCSSCGYNTCREMAEAIYNGYNHKENCVHFLKDVLEGISGDYPTVLLIHEDTQMVHVVKYTGEGAIRTWIESGLALLDYNTAIRDYIHRYVDEMDKDRLLKEVEFDSLMKHLSNNNHYSITYTRHPESGESGFFQLDFNKMVGRNDIILSFHDVDNVTREEQEKEKKLESALLLAEQANKAKSTFLANMSHEIRTPINAILGMDTMILRESNQANVIEYARNVRSASNTLLSLINDILDFSKIESGKMEIIPGEYRLDSVINDLMNMVRSKAEEKGLELILKMQDDIPAQLYGDEVRVKQIILNLLNNAVKYTKEGSVTFEIGYEQSGDDEIMLRVFVRDTGIGIKKEDMKILFSPYERLEENKNKLIEGTGLGLSITLNLLEQMNSELVVDSEYGKGSCFSFKIKQPLWGDDLISQSHVTSMAGDLVEEKTESFHAPDARILVVDDVEMNITVLNGLLKRSMIYPDSCYPEKKL